MDDFEEKLHRTWVQLLIENDFREIAAIAIDSEISVLYNPDAPYGLALDIPSAIYSTVKNSEHIKQVMERALLSVCAGYLHDKYGDPVSDLVVFYRVKLIKVEEGWRNVIKNLIANVQNPNQAVVTEKTFLRDKKQPYTYNEMKFASQSEIRIAQEFERRKILFFPLPLAVRADTGNFYEDHREVDFLICDDGVWGILEVSYHPYRYEKDTEKDIWFKNAGILCIEHVPAESCYNNPSEVVTQFLSILARHRNR